MKHAKKPSKHIWFIHVRGSYLPYSWQGWLSYLPFVAYLLFAPTAAWHSTGSAVLTILYTVPNWIAASVVMTWLARAKS